jgi:O-antigen/teichoic acid export membrane protein
VFETTLVLALTKAATLSFGALLAGLSWRAYRRTTDPALRALAVGIGLVTVGAVLGGVLHRVVDVRLAVAVSVQSVFTAAGFAVLTYSLYAGPGNDTETTENRRTAV